MWVIPSGVVRNTQGRNFGNQISGFGIGLNMACATLNEYPLTGCGRSGDSNITYTNNLVGRFVTGNNAGSESEEYSQYDHNNVADILDYATIGGTYTGDILQGEDESSNTHDLMGACTSNFTGTYASGNSWEASCLPARQSMIGIQPGPGSPNQYKGWNFPLYTHPLDVGLPHFTTPELFGQSAVDCPAGTPSAAFRVVNGIVTHC
jgi:hypothetical protein